MLDSIVPVEATQHAIPATQPTATNVEASPPPAPAPEPAAVTPVLITEQEVMLGTAAAVSPRSTPMARRLIRAAVEALRLPPPRPHYATHAEYIELAAMSRAMEKL